MNIEQVQNELEMLYDTLPEIIFSELNGGILLLPEAKTNPRAGGKYYILGEYCTDGVMGRYIKIYHGSFEAVLGEAKEDAWKSKIKQVLLHELTHHLESLAGENDLEKEDEKLLASLR